MKIRRQSLAINRPPIFRGRKQDLIIFQKPIHERLEIIIPIAMFIFKRGHALGCEINDFDLEFTRNAINELSGISIAAGTGEKGYGPGHGLN